jgi:hypothetical protein
MKKNIGDDDRIIRFVLASLFLVLYLQDIVKDAWGIVFVSLAGMFILTSAVGFCPLYSLFRVDTNRNK